MKGDNLLALVSFRFSHFEAKDDGNGTHHALNLFCKGSGLQGFVLNHTECVRQFVAIRRRRSEFNQICGVATSNYQMQVNEYNVK